MRASLESRRTGRRRRPVAFITRRAKLCPRFLVEISASEEGRAFRVCSGIAGGGVRVLSEPVVDVTEGIERVRIVRTDARIFTNGRDCAGVVTVPAQRVAELIPCIGIVRLTYGQALPDGRGVTEIAGSGFVAGERAGKKPVIAIEIKNLSHCGQRGGLVAMECVFVEIEESAIDWREFLFVGFGDGLLGESGIAGCDCGAGECDPCASKCRIDGDGALKQRRAVAGGALQRGREIPKGFGIGGGRCGGAIRQFVRKLIQSVERRSGSRGESAVGLIRDEVFIRCGDADAAGRSVDDTCALQRGSLPGDSAAGGALRRTSTGGACVVSAERLAGARDRVRGESRAALVSSIGKRIVQRAREIFTRAARDPIERRIAGEIFKIQKRVPRR